MATEIVKIYIFFLSWHSNFVKNQTSIFFFQNFKLIPTLIGVVLINTTQGFAQVRAQDT